MQTVEILKCLTDSSKYKWFTVMNYKMYVEEPAGDEVEMKI